MNLLFKCLIITSFLFAYIQTAQATILNIDKSALKEHIEKMVLIDASNLLRCQKESVKKAKCIPANTFQSSQGVLASFYNITWVFGTAGIQGSEEVLVFADTEKQRDALLGLFYLAGHKTLNRWNSTKADLQELLGKGKGQKRGIIRSEYYTAIMRDKFLILPNELEALSSKGWRISSKDNTDIKQTIVTGKNPLDALARFVRLFMQKTNKKLLKVLIHLPTKNTS